MMTNGGTRTVAWISLLLDLSFNSLSLLHFGYLNYRTEVGFYKKISDAHQRRRETPPILNVIIKTSGIVFTSSNILLMTSGMTKLFPMP